MKYRPPRKHLTKVLYIWGSTGTGKTTMIYRILHSLRTLHITDFYSKMGGLSKWFDGYDNQEIVWIDDPVSTMNDNKEEVQELKTILSNGDILVEIKGGSAVFDSRLVIITCNQNPTTLALACGAENFEPIRRRFIDTCGSYNMWNVDKREDYMKYFITVILNCLPNFNYIIKDDLIQAIVNNMPPIEPNYVIGRKDLFNKIF